LLNSYPFARLREAAFARDTHTPNALLPTAGEKMLR
jgi:hypothetical protein